MGTKRAFTGFIPLGVVQARRNDRFARVEIFVYSLKTEHRLAHLRSFAVENRDSNESGSMRLN